MLRYIGEMPIPDGISIDELESSHEAYIAREILLEKNIELQLNGWWFNKQNTTLVPNYRNEIAIPENVISVDASDSGYIVNEGMLYSPTENTYKFEEPVEVSVVYEISFDDTPLTFATWALYEATSEFQNIMNGDDILEKKLKALAAQSFVTCQREHMRNKDYNLISGARIVSRTTNPTGVS